MKVPAYVPGVTLFFLLVRILAPDLVILGIYRLRGKDGLSPPTRAFQQMCFGVFADPLEAYLRIDE